MYDAGVGVVLTYRVKFSNNEKAITSRHNTGVPRYTVRLISHRDSPGVSRKRLQETENNG